MFPQTTEEGDQMWGFQIPNLARKGSLSRLFQPLDQMEIPLASPDKPSGGIDEEYSK